MGRYFERNFVSSFQKVATFTIVNGAKQGGNVAAYFCAPDGRVLHCVAGPVDAATLLREAEWVVATVGEAAGECRDSETSFKSIFRRRHAERLRREHGIVMEPATFDPPEGNDDGPLTVRDPSGRPLVPALPPPPIDGPDVSFKRLAAAEACAPGAACLQDRCGRPVALGNQGRVHQLLAAYALVKIERVYATVFENILGEKVSTRPVITLDSLPGRRTDLCLHCATRAGAASPTPANRHPPAAGGNGE